MKENKTEISKEIKEFKSSLEKIRREELLAEEQLTKAILQAKETILRAREKSEALIEEKKIEGKEEASLLLKKAEDETGARSEELRLEGEKRKKGLAQKARPNMDKAIESVIKEIME